MLSGREKEQKKLEKLHDSARSELVVIYGRRRIGKTWLVRQMFQHRLSFHVTGLSNADMKMQLYHFNQSLIQYGKPDISPPATWIEAFYALRSLLERQVTGRKVLFFDELPWLDTPRSGFLSAFEHFWNDWASVRNDIMLIACGSAASWITKRLINNRGGLHNRITARFQLLPFTLKECESFFSEKGISMSRQQIVDIYMVLGGIPYYLDQIEKGLSAAQNIDRLCFSKDGILKNEFRNLYASLFKNSESYIGCIEALQTKNSGLTRSDIIIRSGIPGGGTLTTILNDLEESGFIRRFIPFGKQKRDTLYQLTDPFSLFHLRFMETAGHAVEGYWLHTLDNPKHRVWSGLAFENICLLHIDELKRALGISGVLTYSHSWRSSKAEKNVQIDLLIDRRDQVINLCEIKYASGPYAITKGYAEDLRRKVTVFKQETATRKSVHLTLITTYGLQLNEYSYGLVQNEFCMEDLFV
jgi:uncharacterized protein